VSDEEGQQRPPAQQQYNILPSNEAFNRWVESSEPEIKRFEQSLRGLAIVGQDDQGQPLYGKLSDPLLNETGIMWIGSRLRMNVNKNTFMSFIDEPRVYTLCKDFCDALVLTLYLRRRDFEINPAHFFELDVNLANFIEMAFRRAINEGERKRVMPLEHITTQHYIEDQGKGGIFTGLLGGKR
jgi:hypothetical protein